MAIKFSNYFTKQDMQIIPVIDVKNGLAVHAKLGNRSNYQPINTPLCQSSRVVDVVNCFLDLYDFKIIYIADLNAILNQGNNGSLLFSLLKSFPDINFWIDQGYNPAAVQKCSLANYMPVLGSECLLNEHLASLAKLPLPFVLSLDHSDTDELGPNALFNEISYWPENIIIMSIGRVGSHAGPDFAKLQFFCQHYPQKTFIAAGGIRNCEDLVKLEKTGIKQALIASALHYRQIQADEIAHMDNHWT